MPTYIANGVYSMVSGSWMMPSQMSTLLITPFAFKRPMHAYTRSNSEAQNGSTTSRSSTLRVVEAERAMPYAIGYPTARHRSAEMNATLIEFKSAWM